MAQKTYNKRLRRSNGKSTQTGMSGFYSSFNYRPTLVQSLGQNLQILKIWALGQNTARGGKRKKSGTANKLKFVPCSVSSMKQNFLFVRYRPLQTKTRKLFAFVEK